MSNQKRSKNQGEGDRVADRHYREGVRSFIAENDPTAIARKAADELPEAKPPVRRRKQSGKIGWALLWLLGVPLPVLLIIYLIRGH